MHADGDQLGPADGEECERVPGRVIGGVPEDLNKWFQVITPDSACGRPTSPLCDRCPGAASGSLWAVLPGGGVHVEGNGVHIFLTGNSL